MTRARKISRVAVARAGVQVTRREGLEAVTIRAVAARLRVTPMALYRHVESVAGLRVVTLEMILIEVPSAPRDGSARDRLTTFAQEARTALRPFSGVAAALLADWPELVQGCRLVESLLEVAATVTRRTDRRFEIADAVLGYVAARAIGEDARRVRGAHRAAPVVDAHPERFPRLVRARTRATRVDSDRQLRAGLDLMFDGVLPAVTSG
jgi:AcrR family transcriptional regulator